jgi:TRAP-type transport system periplasmic protein
MKHRRLAIQGSAIRFILLLAGLALVAIPTPALAAAKARELKVSTFGSSTSMTYHRVWLPFKDHVEKRSNGALKIDVYPDSSLGKPANHFDMAVRGLADITWGAYAYTPGRFPLLDVLLMPLDIHSGAVAVKVIQEITRSFPKELEKSHPGVKSLRIQLETGQPIHLTKPASKLEDLKGRRISCSSVYGNLFKALDMVPIVMAANDAYFALEKGTVDGQFMQVIGANDWRLQEVAKFTLEVNLGSPLFFTVMNRASWDSLSPDHQKLIESEMDALWSTYIISTDDIVKELKAQWQAKNHKFYRPPQDEMARWNKRFEPLFEKYVADTEAKGLPGKAFLNVIQQTVKKYESQ